MAVKLNVIHNLDCVVGLRELSDESIDLTVTSPPYDNLRDYNGFSFDVTTITKELYRVTKKGGVVVWVVSDATVKGSETGSSFKQALEFMDCGFNLHDTMIYEKKNPVPCVSKRYQPSFEYMFIFSKGSPKTFNPIKVPKTYNDNRAKTNFNRAANGSHVVGKTSPSGERLKRNIWTYAVGKHHTSNDEETFEHPASFPEKLAEDHILSWSNPGDVVLDIFAGSGTTLKMAYLNDREFLGFELSEAYVDIAYRRLNKYIHDKCLCGTELIWMNDFDEFSYYSCDNCGNEVFKRLT